MRLAGKRGSQLDERIEAFMKDVSGLEGKNSNEIREGVRRYMAEYEKQVRIAETDTRKMVPAAQQFRRLCRGRVIEEIQQRTAISTIAHFQIVLSVIEQPGAFQIDR
jgi:predicted phage tail protein